MTANLVKTDYQGLIAHFTEDAWFNATEAAERFGKRPNDWLSLDDVKAYIAAAQNTGVAGISIHLNPGELIRTKRGKNGGTWLHPMLAVAFARWLDPHFAVWCDAQIYGLLRGTHGHQDWKRVRHEATASFKVMTQILKLSREADGKEVSPHHFSNEARLVNWAMTGEFGKLDRNTLPMADLNLLAKLEERNTVLIGRNENYASRKLALESFAVAWRENKTPALEAVG